MIDESLVTLEEFKAMVALWNLKGHKNVIEARFEDGQMTLIVADYVDPLRAYIIGVPFDEQHIFCLDADYYS